MKRLMTTVSVALLVGTTAGHVAAQAIDENAILRLGVLTRITSLDPHVSSLSTQPPLVSAWDRLLRFNPRGEIEGSLAREWNWSEDGVSLTFTLVENATFHDGTAVNAEAVVASIERAKSHPGSVIAPKFAAVESVVAESEYVVRFNLEGGGADLPVVLASVPGSIINPVCIESDVDLTFAPHECTSSAMVLSEGTPGGAWELRRSENPYWDEAAYRYAGIDYILVGDNEVVLNAMLAGDIDTAQLFGEGLDRASDLIDQGRLNGVPFSSDSTRTLGLFLNPRIEPFTDINLRKAVQAAIDPVLLSQGLFAGFCNVVNQPTWTGSWAANAELEEINAYSAETVRELLEAAGRPEGFHFTTFYASTAAHNLTGQVVQAMLAEHGISMTLNPVQAGTVPEMSEGTGQAVISTFADGLHPSNLLDTYTNLASRRLAVLIDSDIEDEVMRLSVEGVDPAFSREEHAERWGQIWQLIYDEAISLPVCQFREIWPTSLRISSSEGDNPDGPIWGTSFEVRYLTIAGN